MTDTKKRHGCLTAWLILVIIVNTVGVATFVLLAAGRARFDDQGVQPFFDWNILYVGIIFVWDLGCAVALFRWKKFGFYGLCLSSLIILFVNLSVGARSPRDLVAVIEVLILYGLLQVGKENKGWDQLD